MNFRLAEFKSFSGGDVSRVLLQDFLIESDGPRVVSLLLELSGDGHHPLRGDGFSGFGAERQTSSGITESRGIEAAQGEQQNQKPGDRACCRAAIGAESINALSINSQSINGVATNKDRCAHDF